MISFNQLNSAIFDDALIPNDTFSRMIKLRSARYSRPFSLTACWEEVHLVARRLVLYIALEMNILSKLTFGLRSKITFGKI